MKNNQKGYLLIEVLIAIVVFGIITVSLLQTITFSAQRTQKSKYTSEASVLIQEAIEASYNVMLTKNINFGNYKLAKQKIPGSPNETWELVTAPKEEKIQSIFTRQISVLPVCRDQERRYQDIGINTQCPAGTTQDTSLKEIKVEITWTENGQAKNIKSNLITLKI